MRQRWMVLTCVTSLIPHLPAPSAPAGGPHQGPSLGQTSPNTDLSHSQYGRISALLGPDTHTRNMRMTALLGAARVAKVTEYALSEVKQPQGSTQATAIPRHLQANLEALAQLCPWRHGWWVRTYQ